MTAQRLAISLPTSSVVFAVMLATWLAIAPIDSVEQTGVNQPPTEVLLKAVSAVEMLLTTKWNSSCKNLRESQAVVDPPNALKLVLEDTTTAARRTMVVESLSRILSHGNVAQQVDLLLGSNAGMIKEGTISIKVVVPHLGPRAEGTTMVDTAEDKVKVRVTTTVVVLHGSARIMLLVANTVIMEPTLAPMTRVAMVVSKAWELLRAWGLLLDLGLLRDLVPSSRASAMVLLHLQRALHLPRPLRMICLHLLRATSLPHLLPQGHSGYIGLALRASYEASTGLRIVHDGWF